MAVGMLGRKVGMTQIYDDSGKWIPVTVIEAGPCDVLNIKTRERDGYEAVRLGFGRRKEKNATKPELGQFKKAGVKPQRMIRELRISSDEEKKIYQPGQAVKVDLFAVGDFLDITGTTIGKGFQGGMKRWGWHGGKASHGSMTHRRPGSIGASAFPSRVFRGHHMPGHMGGQVRTVQSAEVVHVDIEKNLLAVKGQIPGAKNNYVVLKKGLFRSRREETKQDAQKPKKQKSKEKKK